MTNLDHETIAQNYAHALQSDHPRAVQSFTEGTLLQAVRSGLIDANDIIDINIFGSVTFRAKMGAVSVIAVDLADFITDLMTE